MLPSSRRARIVLGVLLGAALILDFLFFSGFIGSDDIEYIGGGRVLFSSYQEPTTLGNIRLGTTVPSGLVWMLSGGSVAAVAWMHVLYHLALVVLAFAIGKLVHDEDTGLVAAGIAATCPILYRFAGAALPDNPGAVWIAVLLLLLELARRDPETHPFRRHFVMGVVLGVAYACKESALIMVIPAAACVIAAAPRLRELRWLRHGAFMAAGLAAFIVVEILVLRVFTGEWLVRIQMVQEHETSTGEYLMTMQSQGGSNPLSRLWFAFDRELGHRAPLSIWLLLAASAGYVFAKGRSLAVLLFFWWPLLYLTLGPTGFDAYRPAPIQLRYYALIVVPAAVMLAAVLVQLTRLLPRWRRTAIAVLLVVGAGIVGHELDRNLPDSGNIYWSERARGFARAYETARTRYPQYPIVFGPLFRERMGLLIGEPPEEVYDERDRLAGRWPEPPYLYIELDGDIAETDRARMGDVDTAVLEVLAPPVNRWEIIKDGLRRLFGIAPHPAVPVGKRGAGGIVLVTRRGETPDLATAREIAWVELRRGVEHAASVDGGQVVSWHTREDFFVQLFDRARRYKELPADPESRLPAGTRRIRVSFPVRLLRGERAEVAVTLYGFSREHGRIDVPAEVVALDAGAPPREIVIELSAPSDLQAFRVRASVHPGTGRPGLLYLGTPRLELLAD
jgi:hypothetical protein